ncbi:MAG: hypothetical protein ACE5DO_13790, partial [Desulfobacterales bacterium]
VGFSRRGQASGRLLDLPDGQRRLDPVYYLDFMVEYLLSRSDSAGLIFEKPAARINSKREGTPAW